MVPKIDNRWCARLLAWRVTMTCRQAWLSVYTSQCLLHSAGRDGIIWMVGSCVLSESVHRKVDAFNFARVWGTPSHSVSAGVISVWSWFAQRRLARNGPASETDLVMLRSLVPSTLAAGCGQHQLLPRYVKGTCIE